MLEHVIRCSSRPILHRSSCLATAVDLPPNSRARGRGETLSPYRLGWSRQTTSSPGRCVVPSPASLCHSASDLTSSASGASEMPFSPDATVQKDVRTTGTCNGVWPIFAQSESNAPRQAILYPGGLFLARPYRVDAWKARRIGAQHRPLMALSKGGRRTSGQSEMPGQTILAGRGLRRQGKGRTKMEKVAKRWSS